MARRPRKPAVTSVVSARAVEVEHLVEGISQTEHGNVFRIMPGQYLRLSPPRPMQQEFPDWKSNLHAYSSLTALQFASTEALDALIDHLWADVNLYHMPRAHVGRNTVIVPTEAVSLLLIKGATFIAYVVPSSGVEQPAPASTD